LGEPEVRGVAADVYGQLHATMRELVRAGVAANPDPDRAADRALAAIDGFRLRALLDREHAFWWCSLCRAYTQRVR